MWFPPSGSLGCPSPLESSSDTVAHIARRTGFGDDERIRRAFIRSLGVSPQDYRTRFGDLTLRVASHALTSPA